MPIPVPLVNANLLAATFVVTLLRTLMVASHLGMNIDNNRTLGSLLACLPARLTSSWLLDTRVLALTAAYKPSGLMVSS